MTSFDTLQSISSRLKELSNQLTSSKLSKEELEEFETLSRKLYERAIILNYKAKEASVYGTSVQETPVAKSEPVIEKIPEVKKEEETPVKVKEKAGAEEIQFDFSSDFDSSKNESIAQPEVEKKTAPEVKREVQVEAPVEKITEPVAEQIPSTPSEEKSSSFYERFSKAHKESAGDRLGTSKIDSLKGAIGLNDRLQFISELFDGNSDSYNSTIDVLDQLENNDVALRKLSEIAVKENWSKDIPAVDEFAHFINRRYAD
ncbi:MAG TPA: hypothetical protein VFD77_05285 [Brumimicrobium sp.]|nr:hypothetical protein [Brumimicrobium sp.]